MAFQEHFTNTIIINMSRRTSKACIIALILIDCNYIDCARSFSNIFSNYSLNVNPEYNSFDLTIYQNPSRFSLMLNLLTALETVFCTLSFDLTTTHGKNYQNFFNKTYDYCSFMDKPTNDFLMLLVHGELSKAGLWMQKCPLQKKIYEAKDFTLNVERFPLFTPEAKYNVTISWASKMNENMINLVTVSVLGRFESTIEVKRRRKAIGRKTKRPIG